MKQKEGAGARLRPDLEIVAALLDAAVGLGKSPVDLVSQRFPSR
jgi:hypothetical protein